MKEVTERQIEFYFEVIKNGNTFKKFLVLKSGDHEAWITEDVAKRWIEKKPNDIINFSYEFKDEQGNRIPKIRVMKKKETETVLIKKDDEDEIKFTVSNITLSKLLKALMPRQERREFEIPQEILNSL